MNDPHEHKFYITNAFWGCIVTETLSDGFLLPGCGRFFWTMRGANRYIRSQRRNKWGYDSNGKWSNE